MLPPGFNCGSCHRKRKTTDGIFGRVIFGVDYLQLTRTWMSTHEDVTQLPKWQQTLCTKLLCDQSVASTRQASPPAQQGEPWSRGWGNVLTTPPPRHNSTKNLKEKIVLTFVLRLTSDGSVSLNALRPCFTSSSKLPAKVRSHVRKYSPSPPHVIFPPNSPPPHIKPLSIGVTRGEGLRRRGGLLK